MTTINDLFPGNSGQLQAMLRMKDPSLKHHPKDETLGLALEQRLREALKEINAG